MKSLFLKSSIIGIVILLFSSFNVNPILATNQTLLKMEVIKLTQQEIDGLLLMREEEKLAHEVYVNLYNKWDLQIFDNISQSELRHTNAIKVLLNEFDIEDPFVEGVGKYSNLELQKLYADLINMGNKSIGDALKVGAIIEDLDIADLNKLIENTENERILQVYGNLNRGSKNHIRAFINQMSLRDLSYTPQYINQSEFDVIIASDNHGRGNRMGNERIGGNRGNCMRNGKGQKDCLAMNQRKGNGKRIGMRNGRGTHNCHGMNQGNGMNNSVDINQGNGNGRGKGMRKGGGQYNCQGMRQGNGKGMKKGGGQNNGQGNGLRMRDGSGQNK